MVENCPVGLLLLWVTRDTPPDTHRDDRNGDGADEPAAPEDEEGEGESEGPAYSVVGSVVVRLMGRDSGVNFPSASQLTPKRPADSGELGCVRNNYYIM